MNDRHFTRGLCLKNRFSAVLPALLVAFIFLADRPVSAQTTFRWNLLSPFWHEPVGWLPIGGPPGSNQIAEFPGAATDTVEWNNTTGNRTAGKLRVLAGNYTFQLTTGTQLQLSLDSNLADALLVSGSGTTMNLDGLHVNVLNSNVLITNGATLNIGDGLFRTNGQITASSQFLNNGTLNITSGADVSDISGFIGTDPQGNSIATITGVGSRWDNSDIFVVGDSGSGTLIVENGGVATSVRGRIGLNAASVGSATVTGIGSRWENSSVLEVGESGRADLAVEHGGVVDCDVCDIGKLPIAIGTVNVTGAGSQLLSPFMTIGQSGTGELRVEDGGLVSANQRCNIGLNNGSDGTVTVTDAGSLLSNLILDVGIGGVGTLHIENGGVVSTQLGANLSEVVGTSGTVSVTGTDSRWDISAGDLFVGGTPTGSGGLGFLNILDLGQVTVFGTTTIYATGTVNLDNGRLLANRGWTNEGLIAASGVLTEIHGDGQLTAGGVIVTATNSSTTFFDNVLHNGNQILVPAGSNKVFLGEVSGAGPFTGDGDVFFEGDLRPGNSAAIVDFEGQVQLGPNNTTFIELGGTNPGEFDQLHVLGDLHLGGDLDGSLINGHTLGFNQLYVICDVGRSLQGKFNNLSEGDRVANFGGQDLFITYTAGDGNDVGLYTGSGTVCAGGGRLVEGVGQINNFNSTCESEDLRWAAHGATFVFSVTDPVVQFELTAAAPAGFGTGIRTVDVEASKANNNAALILRAQLFNFATDSYVALTGILTLSPSDQVKTFSVPRGFNPADFIEPGTNEVRLLLQTTQTSGLPNVRTQLDQVLFNFN